MSVPHSSFAQRAAPLARYSLPSGQVPPFRPNRQLVSSCIAESTLGTRNRQTRRADPGLWGGPHHNNEPAPDPHLRQVTLGNVTTLIDSRLCDEDPRAKAVGVVPVVLTHTTTDEPDLHLPHLRPWGGAGGLNPHHDRRARPGPTPAASHPKGHHDIDGPQSCDRNSHTSHPDPTGRDRPVPRADSPHARFAGATDNGRRERPDGPIWISVSICGQTPQS